MLINWLDHSKNNDVLGWFLMSAMTEAGIDRFTDRFGNLDSSKLDVVLTVNGVEVPVTTVFEVLQGQLTQLKEEARKKGRAELSEKLLDTARDILENLIEEN